MYQVSSSTLAAVGGADPTSVAAAVAAGNTAEEPRGVGRLTLGPGGGSIAAGNNAGTVLLHLMATPTALTSADANAVQLEQHNQQRREHSTAAAETSGGCCCVVS